MNEPDVLIHVTVQDNKTGKVIYTLGRDRVPGSLLDPNHPGHARFTVTLMHGAWDAYLAHRVDVGERAE